MSITCELLLVLLMLSWGQRVSLTYFLPAPQYRGSTRLNTSFRCPLFYCRLTNINLRPKLCIFKIPKHRWRLKSFASNVFQEKKKIKFWSLDDWFTRSTVHVICAMPSAAHPNVRFLKLLIGMCEYFHNSVMLQHMWHSHHV